MRTITVRGFWSLAMYDVPHFFLVANEINRYSIGDRTPGLVHANDGSVTITISHSRPRAKRAGRLLIANQLFRSGLVATLGIGSAAFVRQQ